MKVVNLKIYTEDVLYAIMVAEKYNKKLVLVLSGFDEFDYSEWKNLIHSELIMEEYDKVDTEYNFLVNDLEVTDEELNKAKLEKSSIQNVYEYGKDIVKYVERLSYNKSLLQRNFYVIVSYYSSEITGVSGFSKNEILDICYNELYTRAISIISGLSTCSEIGRASCRERV